MSTIAQIDNFGALLAWMPNLAQIEAPGVHFGAFLAWMPKLAQIEPPGTHFGALLAWIVKDHFGFKAHCMGKRGVSANIEF